MELTNIPPIYVYTQDSTPSDLTEGKIWVDTSTNPPVTKVSDGTTYNALSTNLTPIRKLIGLNGLNILDITAQSTLTEGINANFERDIYSDSTGYLNTIDAGNTTADFLSSTSDYFSGANNGWIAEDTRAHGITMANTTSASGKKGFVVTTNSACYVQKITKHASSNVTKGYILNTSDEVLAQATFSGNDATFSTPLSLATGTTYYIVADADGSSITRSYGGGGYPITTSEFTWIQYYNGSPSGTGESWDIVSVTTATEDITYSNKIVQTNAQPITDTYSNFMIVSNETIEGTETIDYDISFDGGSNEQTGLSSFTEYGITDSGTSIILKQNLNGTDASNYTKASNWGVLLW